MIELILREKVNYSFDIDAGKGTLVWMLMKRQSSEPTNLSGMYPGFWNTKRLGWFAGLELTIIIQLLVYYSSI